MAEERQSIWHWIAGAWFAVLTFGFLVAASLAMLGQNLGWPPVGWVPFSLLGFVAVIGIRTLQYIGYDFSAPDND